MAEDTYAAPGSDYDSRLRDLKTQLAAAQTRGDAATTEDLQTALDALRATPAAETEEPVEGNGKPKRTREAAAAARKTAADKTGDAGQVAPPQGRGAKPTESTAADTAPAAAAAGSGD